MVAVALEVEVGRDQAARIEHGALLAGEGGRASNPIEALVARCDEAFLQRRGRARACPQLHEVPGQIQERTPRRLDLLSQPERPVGLRQLAQGALAAALVSVDRR